MDINERFETIKKEIFGGSQKAFADAIGVAPSVIANVTGTRRGKPSYDVLEKICANANISSDWLLTGRGSILKVNNSIDSGTIVSESINVKDTHNVPSVKKRLNKKSAIKLTIPTGPTTPTESTKELIPLTQSKEKLLDVSEIPLYNIDASAGLNKLFADGGELLGKISIPNAPRCDGAVHVIGDSMSPLLKSGDIIAYRIVNDLQSINFGEVYILQLSNNGDTYIVVKYVKRSDVGSDHIRLVSYNKEYDPKDVPLSWIQAIARVTFCIRRFSII